MKEIESGAIPDPTLEPSGPDEETAVADAGPTPFKTRRHQRILKSILPIWAMRDSYKYMRGNYFIPWMN